MKAVQKISGALLFATVPAGLGALATAHSQSPISDCHNPKTCEQSLRALVRQPGSAAALSGTELSQPPEWLPALLLRLSDDEDLQLSTYAMQQLSALPPLDARYWPQVATRLNSAPKRWASIVLRMRHPEMVPTVLQLIMSDQLAVEVLRPVWPEAQLQLLDYLSAQLLRLSLSEQPMSCHTAETVSHSLCAKLAGLFQALPLSNRLQLWQAWAGRLADLELPDDFVRLLLMLADDNFLRQLPASLAAQTETQLLRLKTQKPPLRNAARFTLIKLGRQSAVAEVTELVKAKLAGDLSLDHLPLSHAISDLAAFAPLVGPSALSGVKEPAGADPDHSAWIILLGMTRQTGAEQRILQAWQQADAPEINAAALVAAAYHSAPLWSRLRQEAGGHWYPAIRTLAASMATQPESATGMSKDQQTLRRKALNVRSKLQVPACKWIADLPAIPTANKWYDPKRLQWLVERFSADHPTAAEVAQSWLNVQTGTEFMPLLAQWGVDLNLSAGNAGGDGDTLSDPTPFHFAPKAALQSAAGWFSVGERGEWGGELRFVNAEQNIQLARGYFSDLFLMGADIVVVVGESFLSPSRLYKVTNNQAGRWALHYWREIPAPANAVWQLADGKLVLQSTAGTFLLSPKGTLQMAVCSSETR